MRDRIQLLPPSLYNQIAAGEVVERPASVVKELLENSLDAGATHIRLYLEKGGTQLIRVEDNGRGINPEDMLLALAAHATSKIISPADLAQIQTLGFRGEALASIASVSRLTLVSCRSPHEALSVHVEGKNMDPIIKPAAHPQGTSVVVKHLFFNTPARQKFLKSDRSELLAVEETLKRIVLMHPHVSFHLYHDQKCIKRYDVASDFKPRIQQVVSRAFMDQALYVDESITQMRLQGWLGNSEQARSSHDQAYLYVNGRPLRDKVLMHAVRTAYGDRIFTGRFPSYVLFLTCDPASVDVNVHPTKHEVRFREARLVHDFIMRSIENALSVSAHQGIQKNIADVAENNIIPQKQQTFSALFQPKQAERRARVWPPAISETLSLGKIVAVLGNTVVILQKDDHLIAIDWQKTLIQYATARFQMEKQFGTIPAMPLLVPFHLPSDVSEATVSLHQDLGFEIQCVGKSQYVIRDIPQYLQGVACRVVNIENNMTEASLLHAWANAWAASHPMDYQAITVTLLACESALGAGAIAYKDYAPEAFLR